MSKSDSSSQTLFGNGGGEDATGRRRLFQSLSFKQARAAVVIGLILGVFFSALQIVFDLKSERQRVDAKYTQLLRTVEDSAIQAAFGLDTQLAQRVVDGLFQYKAIFRAQITDNFKDRMALAVRPKSKGGLEPIATALFGGTKDYVLSLKVPNVGVDAGQIKISIDTNIIAETFFARSGLILIFGILRNLFLATILAVLFYFMLTRPLHEIAEVIKRGSRSIAIPEKHADDELGDLVNVYTELADRNAVTMEALRQSRETIQSLANNLPEFVCLKDSEGRYIFVNKRFEEWVCMSQAEILGKSVHDIYPEERAAEVDALDRRVISDRVVHSREIALGFPDGKTRTVLNTRFPVVSSSGMAIGLGTINVDLSERKAAEEARHAALVEAERANQAKSEFLATMSHDFRTPLNAILGFSEMMRAQYFGPLGAMNYEEYANDIHQSGELMLALINDILDISAIEAGKRPLVKAVLDTDEVLRNCIKNVERAADQEGIALSLEISEDSPSLYADKRSVTQIVHNLLSNAIKFTDCDGKIVVSAISGNQGTIIRVSDSGVGIQSDQLPSISEPFFQTSSDPYVSRQGTGLGLSIVKSLVEAHDGVLSIESEVGRGTIVTVTFPSERPMVG